MLFDHHFLFSLFSDSFVCPGYYRCEGASNCILPEQLCDGERQCPLADDEEHCHFDCPITCICHAFTVFCSDNNINVFPKEIDNKARLIDLNNNQLTEISNATLYFPFLAKLYLSSNMITEIKPGIFLHMRNLLVLDLGDNMLSQLKAGTFNGLSALVYLNLVGNTEISFIEPGCFLGLSSLPVLNLRHMKIKKIEGHTFEGLESVGIIDLFTNDLSEIHDDGFMGLTTLRTLLLQGNHIKFIICYCITKRM